MKRIEMIKRLFEINNQHPYARKVILEAMAKDAEVWPDEVFIKYGYPEGLIRAANYNIDAFELAFAWLDEKLRAQGEKEPEPNKHMPFLQALALKYPIAIDMMNIKGQQIKSFEPDDIMRAFGFHLKKARNQEEGKKEIERAFIYLEELYKAQNN